MKQGKAPTRNQKILLKQKGLDPKSWLIVKDLPDKMEVVSRIALKKVNSKARTRILTKEL